MIRLNDKQLLNMMILEILREYTDKNHRLEQNEIIDLLDKNYNVSCSRKTLYNNLQVLKSAGYEISTNGRLGGTCLLSRQLDDSELYLLIDSVLFSKTLSHKQAKTLIGKLDLWAADIFIKMSPMSAIFLPCSILTMNRLWKIWMLLMMPFHVIGKSAFFIIRTALILRCTRREENLM